MCRCSPPPDRRERGVRRGGRTGSGRRGCGAGHPGAGHPAAAPAPPAARGARLPRGPAGAGPGRAGRRTAAAARGAAAAPGAAPLRPVVVPRQHAHRRRAVPRGPRRRPCRPRLRRLLRRPLVRPPCARLGVEQAPGRASGPHGAAPVDALRQRAAGVLARSHLQRPGRRERPAGAARPAADAHRHRAQRAAHAGALQRRDRPADGGRRGARPLGRCPPASPCSPWWW